MKQPAEKHSAQDDTLLGERRFWGGLWALTLLVIVCTYLTPFFFEWIPIKIFLRDVRGILDWSFSSERFLKSPVVPHCFFSGYLLSMFLERLSDGWANAVWRMVWAIAGGFLFYLLIEIAQVFIPGRTISGGDVLIHLIAYSFGAILGGISLVCFRVAAPELQFYLKCIAVWGFVLTYLSIYPLALKDVRDVSLAESFLSSVKVGPRISDVVANLLLGFPVAWLLFDPIKFFSRDANSSSKWLYPFLWIFVTAVSIGLVVEILQHFFAQRFPSLFDVIFQTMGALGACVVLLPFRLDRRAMTGAVFAYLARLDVKRMSLLLLVFGLLVFEWTPWIPSLEMSTVKEGIRELILPFTQPDYPWDLHWQSNRLGAISLFFISASVAIAWRILLGAVESHSRILRWISLLLCFYGPAVELGKVFISTKYATPLFVLSSLMGGLLGCILLIIHAGWTASKRFDQVVDTQLGEGA